MLPRPPFSYSFHPAPGEKKLPPSKARLVRLSESRNRITDEQSWFRKNGLSLPTFGADLAQGKRGDIPLSAPEALDQQHLIRAIDDGENVHLLYGRDFSGGRLLARLHRGEDPTLPALFDFRNYVTPPAFVKADRELVGESVQWAQQAGGVLYLSNFHRTYAKSSKRLNGYLNAINAETGKLRWRSRPLICNSSTFVVAGDAIVTGYGFTREPDFLYLLNRRDGSVLQSVALKSGPEYIVSKGDRVYVRCYSSDLVFRLKR